jgi:hypothetical protein
VVPVERMDVGARLVDRLDDTSFVTSRYDEEWALPHWDGPVRGLSGTLCKRRDLRVRG